MTRRRLRRLAWMLAAAPAAFALPHAGAITLPPNFQETIAFAGLTNPTAVRFSPDGRVFIAEKSGLIKVFDDLSDPLPTVFADLRTNVHNYWDRGLLGLALHPDFPTTPYVYVLYTLDADVGGTPPKWGTPGATTDGCPTPPGGNTDGCVVAGRLSRLEAAGNVMTGSEQVLIEDWCQQFPSHSVGSLAFGADGALYLSAGDGAAFSASNIDYGYRGWPLVNPCGDPPGGVGGSMTIPTAEGGALRSQDLRTPGDPVTYDGTILRVDPMTGAALPDNPLYGGIASGDDRIVAYGFRNPFRFIIKPGTNELWIGDVGQGTWEEIDRLQNPTGAVPNFGWPCYEGAPRQPGWDAANINMCESLYATPDAVVEPFFAYRHADSVVAGDGCPTGSSSIAGFAFYGSGNYPAEYAGALFFTDFTRKCIWTMLPGADGQIDPATRRVFAVTAVGPVDLQIGPGGDLFYASYNSGTIRRIRYFPVNQPPTARIVATPPGGSVPLTVGLDGSTSTDPDTGDTLAFAWDLDGDGAYDDATGPTATVTFTLPGTYAVGLRVADGAGASSTAAVSIAASNTAPTVAIIAPVAETPWRAGMPIVFAATASDAEEGELPPRAFSWTLVLHHCPSDCHDHVIQDFPGVSGGLFFAPDHDYPSYLELRVTVVDSLGLEGSASLLLYPTAVDLSFDSLPSGLLLGVGAGANTTPFTRTMIAGSADFVSAPSPQLVGGILYKFVSWSDGGAASHPLVAPDVPTSYVATFRAACGDRVVDEGEGCDDGNGVDGDGCSTACKAQAACTTTVRSGSGATLFALCFSDRGNLVRLESPAGVTHLGAGDGYALCSSTGVHGWDAGIAQGGFGPPTTSQPGGPNTLPVTITRDTADGVFRLEQNLAWNASQREVKLTLTVRNLSTTARSGVRVSRYFDADVDNDAADDLLARTADTVMAWEDGSGHTRLGLNAPTFLPHLTAAESFAAWAPAAGGTARGCDAAAEVTPTPPHDGVGRLTYDLGTIAAGTSKAVSLVYRRQ